MLTCERELLSPSPGRAGAALPCLFLGGWKVVDTAILRQMTPPVEMLAQAPLEAQGRLGTGQSSRRAAPEDFGLTFLKLRGGVRVQ